MKDAIQIFVGVLILSSICFFSTNKSNENYKSLRDEFKLAKGKVISFKEEAFRTTIAPKYTYTVDNKTYQGTFYRQKLCKKLSENQKEDVTSTFFDIAYDPRKPEFSYILLTRKDYSQFRVDHPEGSELGRVLLTYFDCEL